jgi:G3E family GTPase
MDRVRVVVVGGFLGAGKTTALVSLARSLEATGTRCAVVLNDQGEGLVDTALSRASDLQAAEVTGGCFCCRFDQLTARTIELVERTGVEVVLAEAVGSCTDLTATVIRPLRTYFGGQFTVAPLVVFVEPPRLRELRNAASEISVLVPYLFEKQLEDADVIVLNKVDLLDTEERAELAGTLESAFAPAEVLCASARTGEGMDALRDRLLLNLGDTSRAGLRSIDYTTYARAEAELAWLNASATVTFGENPATASQLWLREFMSELSELCAQRGLWIGHVKAHLQTIDGMSKASVLRAGDAAEFDLEDPRPFEHADLLVNARVRAKPHELDAVVLAGLARVDEQLGTSSTVHAVRAFSPPPPKPTYRLLADGLSVGKGGSRGSWITRL